MNKKVLIISTSLRKNSNSQILAEEFKKGAVEAENEVEIISLKDKKINFCIGCLACQKTQKCIINDEVKEIIDKMLTSDVIVFSTPIYFYEMSGQMKVLLDRSNPLFPSDYSFRDIYLLAASADTDKRSMDGALKGLQGWIDCFEKASLKGVIKGTGADESSSISALSDILKSAYDMGKNV
ncbi:flavodoxin family protein [Anaerofustis stercorihominis]|uniref:Flavin reductase n=1 Tax=Anaerofustis stercorihominis DSM 17244 TaxID=445971 RepID=B1CAG8_9FIRM|nr:flavodoxin family protein [Anaerofustis stercorihominis]EDS72441.1 flavin reductase [Anaerofustis stercorihominis DSM 17244]MCQ4795318.1 flavodoxin family protein [Anaerofustis stercorihominis]